ncbi:uncharacterized protein V6R79_005429 [Siganus canaliculatus]
MDQRKTFVTVLYVVAACRAIPISDLLDRASQRSDTLHSLSTMLTHDLDSHFPPIGRMMMPRPSMCHTSSLQTPNDKDQALQISESDLLSLARSLLKAWFDPLLVLSASAKTLPHPAKNSISNKMQELQEHSKSLGDGLDILSGKRWQRHWWRQNFQTDQLPFPAVLLPPRLPQDRQLPESPALPGGTNAA